ncbi:hypothetical protein JB92DRAFT_3177185 [Gautieria morchelliformis]|nr:hypothetical protein JB92DRAFT_3177185 [Gautieria morchelliformis]
MQPRQPVNRPMGVQSNMGNTPSHPLTGDLEGPPASRGKHAECHISQKGQDMREQLEAARLRQEKLANTWQHKQWLPSQSLPASKRKVMMEDSDPDTISPPHTCKRRPPLHVPNDEEAMDVNIDDHSVEPPCAFDDDLSIQADNALETSNAESKGAPEFLTESEDDELVLVPPTVSTKAPSGRSDVQFSSVTVTHPTQSKVHKGKPAPQHKPAPVPPLHSITNTRLHDPHDHQSLEQSSSTGIPSSPSVLAANCQPLCPLDPWEHDRRKACEGPRERDGRKAREGPPEHDGREAREGQAHTKFVPLVVRRTSTPIPGHRSKVKLTDFDAEYHTTINLACRFYRVILCTEHPFPLDHEQEGSSNGAVNSSADSAHRTQMATLAQTTHPQAYLGIPDPHDEGVAFHLYFNPVPLPTMALVFTAIANCIDEGKDGQLKAVDFTEKAFRDKDGGNTGKARIFSCACSNACMTRRRRDSSTHSGAGVLQEERQLSQLSNDDFDKAAREAAADSEEEREANA